MIERKRRMSLVILLVLSFISGAIYDSWQAKNEVNKDKPALLGSVSIDDPLAYSQVSASEILETLEVKGRAPRTGYSRSQFGSGWDEIGACDVRNHILKRDLTNVVFMSETDCTVLSGTLIDPYTTKIINFQRGAKSDAVQIDHVVSLSDAWQKGAQQLTAEMRRALANDPLELLAVDGEANMKKADSDAASWLPENKSYRCRFIARQIAVKSKYQLWVTLAEKDAMNRVLETCPDQRLPLTN